MTNEVKAWWERTAEYFQAEIDLDVAVNWTGFGQNDLELLDDVNGADVLELGCGGGQCSVALAQRGGNVTAIDLSEAQLAYARELADEHDTSVDFVQGDITDLSFFEDERFDVAFNAYVFQWVEDLAACFAETYRVLRPGGRFVFSMPHPYYEVIEPESAIVVESYFDTGRQVTESDELDIHMVTFRHTVSDVFNALTDAGFRVDQILEPGTEDPDDYDAGPWGFYTPEMMSKLPATLIFDAQKSA